LQTKFSQNVNQVGKSAKKCNFQKWFFPQKKSGYWNFSSDVFEEYPQGILKRNAVEIGIFTLGIEHYSEKNKVGKNVGSLPKNVQQIKWRHLYGLVHQKDDLCYS
jgi:hypothetical protein